MAQERKSKENSVAVVERLERIEKKLEGLGQGCPVSPTQVSCEKAKDVSIMPTEKSVLNSKLTKEEWSQKLAGLL